MNMICYSNINRLLRLAQTLEEEAMAYLEVALCGECLATDSAPEGPVSSVGSAMNLQG